MNDTVDARVARYLSLEGFEIVGELLGACGATIDSRALPILRRRLTEERGMLPVLQLRGYTRMAEKTAQIIDCLCPLIASLEGGKDGA